jgi:hypothetical protein
MVGGFGGRGFRAALTLPKGVEDLVMPAVVAPDVDIERTPGRGGSSDDDVKGDALGLSGAAGGEGESSGASESNSSSGDDAMAGGPVVQAMEECGLRFGGAARDRGNRVREGDRDRG